MYADPYGPRGLRPQLRAALVIWASLIASLAMLLLCALPALLLSVGHQTGLALLTRSLPVVTTTTAHPDPMLALAAALLVGSALLLRHAGRRCAPDLARARQYRRLRHWNRRVLRASALILLTGIVFTYVVSPLRTLMP